MAVHQICFGLALVLLALPAALAQGSYSGPPQQPPLAYKAHGAPAVYAQPQPVVAAVAKTAVVDSQYDPNPQYNYAYSVSDALTGDQHNHQEARSGDVVQGQYSLVEPDGSLRVVTYHADPVNGFNAVVSREGPRAVGPAPAVAKVAHAAPIAAYAAHPGRLF